MRFTLFLSYFIFFLATATTVRGQHIVHYNERSGLSSNTIGNVIQDRKGYLWFSSWNGLNRYDGYDFQWIKLQPGDGTTISADRIRDILLAPDGNIWCHTDESIFLFDLSTYSFRSLSEEQLKQVAPLMGRTFHEFKDNQGNIWSNGPDPGIFKTTSPHHPAKVIEGTAGQYVRALMIDSKNRLWVATKDDQLLRIYSRNADGSFLLEGYLGSDGTISSSPRPIGGTVYSLYENVNGDIWIGCKPGKLLRWRSNDQRKGIGNKGEMTHISDDIVYDIQRDKSGRLWFSTFLTGIKCCSNPTDATPVLSPSLGGKRVKKILITPDNHAIAATSEGLMTAKLMPSLRDMSFAQVRRHGDRASSLANDITIDITMDGRGNVYVATESSGVDMFRLPLNEETRFTHLSTYTNHLPSDFCQALTVASDSSIIIVGQSNAMLCYTRGDTESETFGNGGSRYVNYNEHFWADTCQFSECRPVRFSDGTWVFATQQGCLAATERSMMTRGFVPCLLFSHVEINGHEIKTRYIVSDSLTLAPNERNITLSFSAIDYTSNDDILYHTSVDGSAWTKASDQRSLTLFDLTPGTHVVKIQSTDCYGRWVDNTAAQTIIVQPYWYETWWATALLWLLLMAIVIGITYTSLHIRKLHRQRRELLQKLMKAVPARVVVESEQRDNISEEIAQSPFLLKIRDFVEANIGNSDVSIDDMAAAVATSKSTLNRRLRSMIGITAAQLLIDARMQRAVELLLQSQRKEIDMTISEIAYKCGYSDPHYFSRCFKQKYGVSPSDYRGN